MYDLHIDEKKFVRLLKNPGLKSKTKKNETIRKFNNNYYYNIILKNVWWNLGVHFFRTKSLEILGLAKPLVTCKSFSLAKK